MGQSKKIEKSCLYCSEKFMVFPSQIKKGGGKFCSISCGTTYRNKKDNPSKRAEVRKKISENHADVSGEKNPMYGKRGKDATGYIDGRYINKTATHRRLAIKNLVAICYFCEETDLKKLDVHHKDGNHKNNEMSNLVFMCRPCHITKAHAYERDSLGRFVKSKTIRLE
jgi:hypothetical protein